jgi:hypothetical protein
MYNHTNEWLKPGTISKSSLSQKIHSEEIGDHFFEIIGKDSSVLGKVFLKWCPRWIYSDSLAPRIGRCRTNPGLLGCNLHQI